MQIAVAATKLVTALHEVGFLAGMEAARVCAEYRVHLCSDRLAAVSKMRGVTDDQVCDKRAAIVSVFHPTLVTIV